MKIQNASEFVVITSFFNPGKFTNRVFNYRKFREHLDAFLITVELSNDNDFYLNENDSDLLIRVKSDSQMWQKERLLNIAIQNIPLTAKYVAWIDADIIFSDSNWINNSIKLLNHYTIIQPFKILYDLKKNEMPNANKSYLPSGYSFCYKRSKDSRTENTILNPNTTNAFRETACGLAWVSRVEILKQHGFYDVMIAGSGDRMLAFATINKFEDAIQTTVLNRRRATHYLKWAGPFFKSIQSNIGYLEGEIFHLWHGELNNRGWLERHRIISNLGFDPKSDLFKNKFDCWEWASDKKELKEYLSAYFSSRKEDD